MELNEKIQLAKQERDIDRYYKEYRPQMDILEGSGSLIKKVRSITSHDVYALGKQLEQFDLYKKVIQEDDGTLASLGRIPTVAFDIISVVYASSPISVIASVQPIEEEKGLVYYRSVVAQTTRGNVTAGDRLLTTYVPPDTAAIGFSGDTSSQMVTTSVAGQLNYTLALTNAPVRPQYVSVMVQGQNLPNQDDGLGNILGKGIQGSINYSTGVVSIQLANDPGAGAQITVQYAQDYEASPDIPKIISKIDSKSVKARIFALKDTMGLLESYAMRKRFGMSVEDEAAADLVGEINSEIVNTMIVQLAANVTGNVTQWPKTAPSGVSYFEHKQTIMDAIASAETQLLLNAGRGSISVMIAGVATATVLSTLPGFTRIADGNQFGPHIFGTLNGTTVVRVPDQRVLDSNTILCLYNGNNPFDAAGVYSPYMPLFITGTLQNGINPLMQQKAAAVWAGVDVLVP